MLDYSGEARWRDVCACEEKLEKMFASHDNMVARYHSPFFKGDGEDEPLHQMNHAYEWFAATKAQIQANQPRWMIKPRRSQGGTKQIASAYRSTMNRWSTDSNLKSVLDKLYVNWGFRRCVALVRRKQVSADLGPINGPVYRPEVIPLNLRRYGYDPLATEEEEVRIKWHKSIYDLDHMIDTVDPGDGWDIDLMKTLQVNQHVEDLRPERKDVHGASERRDIVVYEMWAPELQQEGYSQEDGYWGSLLTYAYTSPDESQGKQRSLKERTADGDGTLVEICKPRPYFGPRNGPYYVGYQDYVPDEVEGMSQFVAIEQQLRNLNASAAVMQRAMEDYKRILLVNAKDSSLAAKIKGGRHHSVIPVKAFSKDDVFAAEIGGPTDQMVKALEFRRAHVNQLTGLTETFRGNIDPSATATAEAIAQGGANARIANLRNAWYGYVARLGRAAAEIMFMDDEFVQELDEETVAQFGQSGPLFIRGGREPGQSFEDLEIDVEPLSMEFTNEFTERQRAMEQLAVYQQVSMSIVQAPWMDWDGILSDVGDAIQNPFMRERVNYRMASEVAGLMIGMQMAGASQQGSPTKPQPSMSKDNPSQRQPTQYLSGGKGTGTPGQQSGGKAFGASKKTTATGAY